MNQPRKPTSRITYQEVTQTALQQALHHKQSINLPLVHAQLARQILDKLIGYSLSPLVLEFTKKARSVGRVQSAALAILCQREAKIEAFQPQAYWVVKTEYEEGLTATFLGTVDDRIDATDEESQVDDTGEAPPDTQTKRRKVLSEAQANEIVAIAQQHPHQVVQSRQIRQSVSPPPPLTTASLQKLADSRYGFAPDHTMSVAQALFEQGLITYHRTDSVALSDDFCQSVREWLGATYPELVPSQVIKHRLKKAAQAAHEAIRPTKVVQRPDLLETTLDLHHLRLYELIWQRAVASQCAPAQVDKTWVIIVSGHTFWDVRGRVMVAPGYATIFNNLTTDMMLPNVPEGRECLDFCVSR